MTADLADLAAAQQRAATGVRDQKALESTLKACAHMLASTEQVLHACAAIHAGGPMAQALAETNARLAQFIKALPLA